MNILNKLFKVAPSTTTSSPKVDYNTLIERGFLLVDVRTSDEYRTDNISQSINVPLSDLKSKLTYFSESNRPIIFYCKSGRRAEKAVTALKAHHIECYNGGALNALKNTLNRHQYGVTKYVREAQNFAPVIPVKSQYMN